MLRVRAAGQGRDVRQVGTVGAEDEVQAEQVSPADPTGPVTSAGPPAPGQRRVGLGIGRLADGWFPQVVPGPPLEEAASIVAGAARKAGRDPSAIGMEGRVTQGPGDTEVLVDHVERWRRAGATHVAVNTMGTGHRARSGSVAGGGAEPARHR